MKLFLLLFCFLYSKAEDAETAETSQDVEPEYSIPEPKGVFFLETFQGNWESRWKRSTKEKFRGGEWRVGQVDGDTYFKIEKGLILGKPAQHHAISATFDQPISGQVGKDLVVQYEVRFHKQHQCGGAYVKLLTADKNFKPAEFDNETPYTIMFGPDKCGTSDKIHFIIRHQSPVTKKWEEKHMKSPPTIGSDTKTHLYTLVIRHDNTFEVFLDQKSVKKGSLKEDLEPAIDPPKEIDDPQDSKPKDWVDEAEINDPTATKPDDWDEDAPLKIPDENAVKPSGWCDDCPAKVPDPEAEKPEDWDDELDGEWIPPLVDNPVCEKDGCGEWKRPMISNPNFKGPWKHPKIPNPAYKGPWKARQIPNPDYFTDDNPHKLSPIGGIGFELWTMQEDIEFDNILIDTNEDAATQFASATWAKKFAFEKAKGAASGEAGGFESYANMVSEFVSEKPGVFVAVVVGLVTAFVVILYFCCTSSAPRVPEHREEKPSKKKAETSAASGDDTKSKSKSEEKEKPKAKETEKETEREDESEGAPQTDKPKKRPTKKAT